MISCPICGEITYLKEQERAKAWRYEHDQKHHPEYWSFQTSILEDKK